MNHRLRKKIAGIFPAFIKLEVEQIGVVALKNTFE